MPSKEEDPLVASAATAAAAFQTVATGQDFLSRDVDQLVAEIKENLRLTSLKSRCQRRQRPSPYRVPSVGANSGADAGQLRGRKEVPEDPYELLQVLLREGGLIKEAVRRLQEGLAVASGGQRHKKVLRELDEGTCTPVGLCGVDV